MGFSVYRRSGGLTLVEVILAISLLLVLSFATFKGARVGLDSWNDKLAVDQAKSLANLLRVDYELANVDATSLVSPLDFFGHLYTLQWPTTAAGVFVARSAPLSFQGLSVDNRGCIVDAGRFTPCFTRSQGLWVEVLVQEQARQVRPSSTRGQADYLVDVGLDAKAFQNHYFGQRGRYTGEQLVLEEQVQEDQQSQEQVNGQ